MAQKIEGPVPGNISGEVTVIYPRDKKNEMSEATNMNKDGSLAGFSPA